MCGINGIFNSNGRTPSRATLEQMNHRLVHRGPDQTGVYLEGAVALGHQRLSIIDIASGAQPMSTADGRYTIVFNGEIYNYTDIRAELRDAGISFRTNSDTEVILNSFVLWKERSVDRLRGMFAFAIWDRDTQELFCARDRLGIKPFLYSYTGDSFVFSSEIKALLSVPEISVSHDPECIDAFLTLGYVPGELTGYNEIKKLPAGKWLKVTKDGLERGSYWDVSNLANARAQETSYADAVVEMRSALSDAVAVRLMSEVPLGAFLSGGIDSTSIVALMSSCSDTPVKTITIGFEEAAYDESEIAAISAKKFKTDHTLFTTKPDPLEIVNKILPHVDSLCMDTSLIPTYYVCQSARKKAIVILSGDGGDEVFAGYNWYPQLAHARSGIAGQALHLLSHFVPPWLKGAAHLQSAGVRGFDSYLSYRSVFTPAEKKSLYRQEYKKLPVDNTLLEKLAVEYNQNPEIDPVRRAQRFDLKYYLVDNILYKVDIMSMAHSIEVRSPLLDYRFVEKMYSLPTAMKYDGTVRKKLLKEAMSSSIPPEVTNGKKRGFVPPVSEWLRSELKPFAEGILLSNDSVLYRYIDKKATVVLWHRFLKNPTYATDLTNRIWALITLELWLRQAKTT